MFAELYTAEAIAAVLQEWYKTMGDLPLILRQAAQMGLFSSAALVRFLSMDVRPSMTRFVTRTLPPSVSHMVVGSGVFLSLLMGASGVSGGRAAGKESGGGSNAPSVESSCWGAVVSSCQLASVLGC